jgi:hypothetical protein
MVVNVEFVVIRGTKNQEAMNRVVKILTSLLKIIFLVNYDWGKTNKIIP